jgi:hypothetical protein
MVWIPLDHLAYFDPTVSVKHIELEIQTNLQMSFAHSSHQFRVIRHSRQIFSQLFGLTESVPEELGIALTQRKSMERWDSISFTLDHGLDRDDLNPALIYLDCQVIGGAVIFRSKEMTGEARTRINTSHERLEGQCRERNNTPRSQE